MALVTKLPATGSSARVSDGYGFIHVPGEGPGLQLAHEHQGPGLHGLAAVVRLRVVVPVPILSLLHCEVGGTEKP